MSATYSTDLPYSDRLAIIASASGPLLTDYLACGGKECAAEIVSRCDRDGIEAVEVIEQEIAEDRAANLD